MESIHNNVEEDKGEADAAGETLLEHGARTETFIMTPCVVFDLDGTLSDCSERLTYIKNKPKNFSKFYADIPKDPPVEAMLAVLKALHSAGHTVAYCTGREETTRNLTVEWLQFNMAPITNLYMRKLKDNRRDDIVKEELLAEMRRDGLEPFLVFEDRKRVVDMWRRNGIQCAQVADGDF